MNYLLAASTALFVSTLAFAKDTNPRHSPFLAPRSVELLDQAQVNLELGDPRLAYRFNGRLKVDQQGRVYVHLDQSATFVRLNPETGGIVWKKVEEDGFFIARDACLQETQIYFASSESFKAVDKETGATLWSKKPMSPSFCFFGGEELEHEFDGRMTFIHARTGIAGPVIQLVPGFDLVSFDKDVLYGVVDKDNPETATLYAYDKRDAKLLWSRRLGKYTASWMLKGGGHMELSAERERLLLDKWTGVVINSNSFALATDPMNTQGLGRTYRYSCRSSGSLVSCSDLKTKKKIWTVDTGASDEEPIYDYPYDAGDYIIASHKKSNGRYGLILLKADSGEILWRKDFPAAYRIEGHDSKRLYLSFSYDYQGAVYNFQ